MIISLVVAASENNVIGKDNKLLWHLPNDLKFFKNTTWGMPVIMGRKTFESFGKPLSGRTNIVITRKNDWNVAGVIVVNSLEKAIEEAKKVDAKEAFVIGGGEIYQQSLHIANKIFLTRVHTIVEGDTMFPKFSKDDWKLLSELNFKVDDKHAFDYSFQVWERKVKGER